MNFRSTTLHIRESYTEPPLERVLIETLEASMTAVQAARAIAPAAVIYPKTKASYPPEIPQELEPEDLPLIAQLPPPSVKWLRQPQEPVGATMPPPVRILMRRTRTLYKSLPGCRADQGWGLVCLRRYGARILAVRRFLTRPRIAPAAPPQSTLMAPVKKKVMRVRRTMPKGQVPHSGPSGIGCTSYDGYSFYLQWEGDAIGNMTLIVKLNGTQIFDTGLTGNNAKSLTLKTDAGIPATAGIFNGLFAKSLFKSAGNILKLEFTGDIIGAGLNVIQAVDEYGWLKNNAAWSLSATSTQLTDFSYAPPIIVPPAIGSYPLTYNLQVVGVC